VKPQQIGEPYPLLKPGETTMVGIPSQGQLIDWRLTVQYYTLGTKRQLRDKLWSLGVSGRLLRPIFNEKISTDWVSAG
jgi:hypothetical protein